MATTQTASPAEWEALQPLHNGDRLAAREFLRRYEAMPGVKKAELIDHFVFMASPVSNRHAEADNALQGLFFLYANANHGTIASTNPTLRLGEGDVVQPDALLRRLPENGGTSSLDENGYVTGTPELVAEIAASTTAIDLHKKRDSYLRASVPEYLVWDVVGERLHHWRLDGGDYHQLPDVAEGVTESRVFPGLRIDRGALDARDAKRATETLRKALG